MMTQRQPVTLASLLCGPRELVKFSATNLQEQVMEALTKAQKACPQLTLPAEALPIHSIGSLPFFVVHQPTTGGLAAIDVPGGLYSATAGCPRRSSDDIRANDYNICKSYFDFGGEHKRAPWLIVCELEIACEVSFDKSSDLKIAKPFGKFEVYRLTPIFLGVRSLEDGDLVEDFVDALTELGDHHRLIEEKLNTPAVQVGVERAVATAEDRGDSYAHPLALAGKDLRLPEKEVEAARRALLVEQEKPPARVPALSTSPAFA
jgi:hypothetical protein